jgi:hypothetical protein
MAKLQIKTGSKAGQIFELPEGPVTIGRGPQNTFAIVDESISTQHLLVMSDKMNCRIKDRGSSNGTFVNGEPVTNATLSHGDTLRLGDVEMVVLLKEERQAPTPGGAMGMKKKALPKLDLPVAPPLPGTPPPANRIAKKKAAAGPSFEAIAAEAGPKKRIIKVELPILPILTWVGVVAVIAAGAWQLFGPKKKVVAQPNMPGQLGPVAPVSPTVVAPPAGFVQQDEPPALPYELTIGPAAPLLSSGLVRKASEMGSAQAAVSAAKAGDAVVFDLPRSEPVVVDQPITNVQFIGGAADWVVKADMVDCQFFWHTPVSFQQESGVLDHCAFYRSHSSGMRLNHSDAVSLYYGGEILDPAINDGKPQVQFTGFIRGVTIHKPVLRAQDEAPRWDMLWPPVFQFHSTDTNAPGYHSYVVSPLTVGQTAWTPLRIVRGVGITIAQAATVGNVWANPVLDINYGIDCVVLAAAFGGQGGAANAGYLRQPDKLKYAGHFEWGHNSPYAPFRGAAVRVAGQRNRLIGIGNLLNWSVGPRRTLPGLHYGDGVIAKDPFLQEWSAESVGLTMNFAEPKNIFKLDWGYRAAPEVKSTGTNNSAKYPLLGPNVGRPVFVPLQDMRAPPPTLHGQTMEDFTGRSADEILKALRAGKYVYLGEGAYEFKATVTNGLIFGAGMDRTLITWPEKIDCATRNCLGLLNLTVKGGRYGYNSQAGSGGLTNTANALIVRTRFQDQKESAINAHCFQDQVYQDCEFVGCRNGITQGRLRGSTYWWSQRGRGSGRRVVRLNIVNCRFRQIRERAIDLVSNEPDEGVVAIQNCVFEEIKGQAIRLLGGKSHIVQGCRFGDVGFPGSRYAVMQVTGQGTVTISHLNFENVAGEGTATAMVVDGIPTVSHCSFTGFDQTVITRNPLVMDHCESEEGRLDLPFGSLVFMSSFANADVSKGVMEVVSADNFKSMSLEAKVQLLDVTPPPEVKAVRVGRTEQGNKVSWGAVNDAESGILRYLIYADGKFVGQTPLQMSPGLQRGDPFYPPAVDLSFIDPAPNFPEYEVRAVNGANLISGIGPAPIRGWGALRPKFRKRRGEDVYVADIRYEERRRVLEVSSTTLEVIPGASLDGNGSPYMLTVEEGALLEVRSKESGAAVGP